MALALELALPYPPRVTNTQLSRLFTFLIVVSALAACSKTTTNISQSYRNPGYEQTVFKKLFVIGVAQNQESRQAFEDAFAKAIVNQGGAAQTSWGVLPQSEQLSEEEIQAAIEGGNFDGVLITRMLSVDKDQEYVDTGTAATTVSTAPHTPRCTSRAISKPARRSDWKPISIQSRTAVWSGPANQRRSTRSRSPTPAHQ
ncbi:MAG: hypothetical protein JRF48_06825 [Deltaproteobacteria bacterium]|nr:hypothetical protein [Deltaproteobacteria bacterium]